MNEELPRHAAAPGNAAAGPTPVGGGQASENDGEGYGKPLCYWILDTDRKLYHTTPQDMANRLPWRLAAEDICDVARAGQVLLAVSFSRGELKRFDAADQIGLSPHAAWIIRGQTAQRIPLDDRADAKVFKLSDLGEGDTCDKVIYTNGRLTAHFGDRIVHLPDKGRL